MSPHRDRTAWLLGGDALCLQPPTLVQRAWRLVLLGAPGIGKGTQANLLSHALGACPLSTGDIFRASHSYAVPPGSAMAEAQEAMARGDLVPDDVVIGVLRERGRCLRCSGGFLLDGFPRTLPQAISLDAMLEERGLRLDAALSYELPVDALVERLADRRVCRRCHMTYHLLQRPPLHAGCCDRCGGPLQQLPEDRPARIRERLQLGEAAAAGVRRHYQETGRLLPVDAGGTPAEILARTLNGLAGLAPPAQETSAGSTPSVPTSVST